MDLNPFAPSLSYPCVVNFNLDAISLPSGGLITGSGDSIQALIGVAEASTLGFLALALLAGYLAVRIKMRDRKRIRLKQAARRRWTRKANQCCSSRIPVESARARE